MLYLVVFAGLVLAAIAAPGLWVRHVMDRYSQPDDRYPGTGAELARHLLERLGIEAVAVEESRSGDHYDPARKVLRLTPRNFHGRSLTAITVAAHEVGHALQDHQGYAPLRWRSALIGVGQRAERLGGLVLLCAPLVALLVRAPQLGLLMALGGFAALFIATLVHLLTLPTELDASFVRALPMLERGGYVHEADRPHARRLLAAAAMTYLGASLLSLLNLGRWWALLRR